MYFVRDTSNFFNNCLQDRLFHCITFPVVRSLHIPKLTVPSNSLEKSRKLCHGFRSFWWVNWHHLSQLEVYLWLYFKAYLQNQCQDLRGKNVDLHKSGSSLGAISKRLEVPRSSVQTIVRKDNHPGTKQPSYRSGRRHVLSPRDESTLVYYVVGVLCCRRDWCTSQNRWNHEKGKVYGYIEATSQDISQEVKAWS